MVKDNLVERVGKEPDSLVRNITGAGSGVGFGRQGTPKNVDYVPYQGGVHDNPKGN